MDNELIRRIVEFVEEASPIIWAAVQREVRVTAAIDLVWAAIWLVAGIVLVYTCVRCRNKYLEDTYDNNVYDLAALLAGLGATGTIFLFVFLFLNAIGYLLNPDYHAIKILIELFPGG